MISFITVAQKVSDAQNEIYWTHGSWFYHCVKMFAKEKWTNDKPLWNYIIDYVHCVKHWKYCQTKMSHRNSMHDRWGTADQYRSLYYLTEKNSDHITWNIIEYYNMEYFQILKSFMEIRMNAATRDPPI